MHNNRLSPVRGRLLAAIVAVGGGCACANHQEMSGLAAPTPPAQAERMPPVTAPMQPTRSTDVAVAQESSPNAKPASNGAPSMMTTAPAMSMPVAGSPAVSAAPTRLSDDYYAEAWSSPTIPSECQGFALEGLRYSPGGLLLPNRCEPFHATTNNPFAVRCVDVWADYKTAFPGDNYCILPPAPGLGLQIGAHPQTAQWYTQVASGDLSGYDNPADEWVMQPGEEETISYRTSSSNTESRNYYRVYYRMRPGSHHMGVSANDDPTSARDVWLPGSMLPSQLDPSVGTLITSIGAVQRPDDGSPDTFDKPIEDEGLYSVFPAGAAILMNMHHFNFNPTPLLKEVWVNVFWESDVRFKVDSVASVPVDQALTLAVPAGDTIDLHYFWNIAEPLRLLRLFAHRHSWTPNFSAWIKRAGGGEPEIVYQSFDWFDVPTYRYDSLRKNPSPNPLQRMDGGASGVLELQAGDQLHFNCHITFTDARAAQAKLPKSATQIGTLKFANEAYTAEMCSLIGDSAKGPKLPTSPEFGEGPLPDFAKLE